VTASTAGLYRLFKAGVNESSCSGTRGRNPVAFGAAIFFDYQDPFQ